MWLRHYKHGFTLIELLIVIVIIGILVAIGVPAYLRYVAASNDRAAQALLWTAYKAAISGTTADTSRFPSSTSLVGDVVADQPTSSVVSGDCAGSVAVAPVKQVVIDAASTSSQVQMCTRSASGEIWKLSGPPVGTPTITDTSLVALAFSGTELTDAARAARVQGDGAAPNSSTGIWSTMTNRVATGGFEAGIGTWTSELSGAPTTVEQSQTGWAEFGSHALRFTVTAGGVVASGGALSAAFGQPAQQASVSTGQTYTASAWTNILSNPGADARIEIAWCDASGNVLARDAGTGTAGTGIFRLTVTATAPASAVKAIVDVKSTNIAAGQSFDLYLDGVQLELNGFATPYIDTNGATASRTSSGIQVPSSYIDQNQMWIAFRVRPGWATSPAGSDYFLMSWASVASDKLDVIRHLASGWSIRWLTTAGGQQVASQTVAFSQGASLTVIAYMTPTVVAMSVNGANFTTTPRVGAGTITLPATFYLGRRQDAAASWWNGDMLWVAMGKGTLTNADAVTIDGFGDHDPAKSAFPAAAQTTIVWDGTSSAASLK